MYFYLIMPNKYFSLTVFLLCWVVITGYATEEQPPNIVFVFSDDHACHAIGAYGSKINQTPHIDQLAKDGVLFENSFCANAICGPSRACVLTGKHSHTNGYKMNMAASKRSFDGTQPTFMNLLKKNGYQTALIGKWHLGNNPTDAYGIDHWDLWSGGYYNPVFISKHGKELTQGYSTTLITHKTIQWIKKRDKKKPFVVMCTLNAPHRTWAPELKYLKAFQDQLIPEPSTLHDHWKNRTQTLAKNRQSIKNHFFWKYDLKVNAAVPFATEWENKLGAREYNKLSPDQKKMWNAHYGPQNRQMINAQPKGKDLVSWKYQRYIKDYLRCVMSVDDSVGKLREILQQEGIADNTLFIYSSDQGFFLGEHGMYDKRWMYEESLRMPFIASWPAKIKSGSRVKLMIQNIDYAPTFLEAAGVRLPEEMQGVSLLSLMQGKKIENWRDSIYYHFYENTEEHNAPKHEGVRTKRYKLMHFYEADGYDLFDLQNDPNEMTDVSKHPRYQRVFEQMKRKLTFLRNKYDAPPLKSGPRVIK